MPATINSDCTANVYSFPASSESGSSVSETLCASRMCGRNQADTRHRTMNLKFKGDFIVGS